MNFKEAKQYFHETPQDTETCLAYYAVLDEAEKLQKAFALACRHLHDEFGLGESGPALQRAILDRVDDEYVCSVCGCTEDDARIVLHFWASEDLCSACAGKDGNNGTIK